MWGQSHKDWSMPKATNPSITDAHLSYLCKNGRLNEAIESLNSIASSVVVDFTASWCGPCRLIAPLVAELAKKMLHVIFLKVDVDELREVAEEWEVNAMPTFLFFKDGKQVHKIVGARREDLPQAVEKYAAF